VSAMHVETLSIPGVLLFRPELHSDARGFLLERFRMSAYRKAGVEGTFVQSNLARSVRKTLRGLHFQVGAPQSKLIDVSRGEVFDVVVDLRASSASFAEWQGVVLSEDNRAQLYVPAGCAHGFCVMSDVADVQYQFSTEFDPAMARGVRWNDPEIGVKWPVVNPLLSPADAARPFLAELNQWEFPATGPQL